MKSAIDRARSLSGSLLIAVTVALTPSCRNGNETKNVREPVTPSFIVAGSGEKTFTERYRLSIGLPIPEAKFLAILKGLNLRFEVYGERGSKRPMPPLHYSSLIDASKLKKVYEIYGDRAMDVSEVYRAFVDSDDQVVYIENAFSYTGT